MRKKLFLFAISLVVCVVVLAMNAISLPETNTPKDDKYRTFKKTKNKCTKCSCKGYWGYKHGNGTYEGNCSNTDSWGYTCKHGPEKLGLRKW